jgi:GT2 family glycosyltransferase
LASASAALLDESMYEWIIVDNASNDQSETIIKERFPFVHWIGLTENVGFARANNKAIAFATGDTVLLLNPDTIILPDSIEQAYQRLLNSSHVACGVQLVYPDLSAQFTGSYFVKGGLNHLLPIPYWGACIKWMASLLIKEKPAIIQASNEQQVDWMSGAFLMVKKEAIQKVGMLDDDFFLYAEEVEWCSRLRKEGTICIYGDLKLIHLIGTSIQAASGSKDNSYTNLSDKKGLQLMVSNHLRIRKQYGVLWYLFQLLQYTWGVPFSWIVSTLTHLFTLSSPAKDWKNLMGFTKNVWTLWRLMPLMLANRPHFYKCL